MKNLTELSNLSILLPDEREELRQLVIKWREAKQSHDWEIADKLRLELYEWDTQTKDDGIWFPIFETFEHRKKRAEARMKLYNISIYPFEIENNDQNDT